jgi:hypothetical protein
MWYNLLINTSGRASRPAAKQYYQPGYPAYCLAAGGVQVPLVIFQHFSGKEK